MPKFRPDTSARLQGVGMEEVAPSIAGKGHLAGDVRGPEPDPGGIRGKRHDAVPGEITSITDRCNEATPI